MVYKFFDKKSLDATTHTESDIIFKNQVLAFGLYRPITRKFKKCKIYSFYWDKIWSADLADVQLISKYNKGVRFLMFLLIFTANMLGLFRWNTRKGITITAAFQRILDDSHCKPNKMWVYQTGKVYNRSMNQGLHDKNIEMYLKHNEGKSVVAERSTKTLRNKIYKHTSSVSKKV